LMQVFCLHVDEGRQCASKIAPHRHRILKIRDGTKHI